MRKKEKWISLIIVVAVLLVFVKFASILGENKPEKEEELDLAVKLNLEGDFPNPEEGTAVFNIRLFMDNIILKSKRVPKYVIFAESETIPRLIFRYNLHNSVFEGGLPLIRSEEVVFLDGNIHEVAYTFKRGGKQKIFFDGKEVASGDFDASKIGITGFAVSGFKGDFEIIDVEGEVEFK